MNKTLSVKCTLCRSSDTSLMYLAKDGVSQKNFNIFYCPSCQNGFTWPQPENFSAYYPKLYYSHVKNVLYSLLQKRRAKLIKSLLLKGRIIDIGCGEGILKKQLDPEKYTYQGIETPFSGVNNSWVKLTGVEKMNEKANSYDIVSFWHSFEHLISPIKAINKSRKILKEGKFLIIECPNYNCLERKIFKKYWYHLDPPRHLFHYSIAGLTKILKRSGFKVVKKQIIFAPEYVSMGLTQSIVHTLFPDVILFALDFRKRSLFFLSAIYIILAIVILPLSYIIYLLGSSPIQLIIAKKK